MGRGMPPTPRSVRPLPLGARRPRPRGSLRNRAGSRLGRGVSRGVVAEAPSVRTLQAAFRLFRHEVRRWHDGAITDIAEAIECPQRLRSRVRPAAARTSVQVSTAVWGRDDLHAGEMWNSNSTVSCLIASSGLDAESIHPRAGGRDTGWQAGVVVARREETAAPRTPGRVR
jgi:hypothetical protein